MVDRERRDRLALNEASFRDVNDRLRRDLARLASEPEQLDLVCECSRLDCRETVSVTPAEYESVRADPTQFLVCLGHETPDVEDVVRRAQTHAVVRKHPDTHPIARETDPRS